MEAHPMPMHDWPRVRAGIYHNFHYSWLAAIMDRLNGGTLPAGWFAMAERDALDPKAEAALADPGHSMRKTHRIAIHIDIGTAVAVLEAVSPGNKDTRASLRSFARKSAGLIRDGVHLSVIDPFPPGRHDRNGIHRAIWDEVTLESSSTQPPGRPLTLAAYQAGDVPTAYVEPFAVGAPIPDLPLFLDEGSHVLVPLEETYQATWAVLPQILRDVVAASGH
jgi:hypothetical protein